MKASSNNTGDRAEALASNSKNEEKRMNRIFYTVFISLILDLLAFTVILPLLPSLLEHYSQSDKVNELLINFFLNNYFSLVFCHVLEYNKVYHE